MEYADVAPDQIAKAGGFEDWREFCTLVASVDLSTAERLERFNNWKLHDGTKTGLLLIAA